LGYGFDSERLFCALLLLLSNPTFGQAIGGVLTNPTFGQAIGGVLT